jgi:hypothetical protein
MWSANKRAKVVTCPSQLHEPPKGVALEKRHPQIGAGVGGSFAGQIVTGYF